MNFTVELPNNGHIGGGSLVHYREVVPISEIRLQATPLNPEVANRSKGVACSVFMQTRSKRTQDEQTKDLTVFPGATE